MTTPPAFAHLRALIDGRGIWQHAIGPVPDPAHGYCLDDAARAAIVAADLAATDPTWRTPLFTCCRFVDAAVGPSGLGNNFMDASGRWLDEPHDGDHIGRAIWALGVLSNNDDPGLAHWAAARLRDTLADTQRRVPLHTRLYVLLGLAAATDRELVEPVARRHLDGIVACQSQRAAWPWVEARVRYDAGRLPEALLRAGRTFGHQRAVDTGFHLLAWLTELVSGDRPYDRYPGHLGLGPHDDPERSGDEQPLEPAALAAAHAAASDIAGSDTGHHDLHVRRALAWFHGQNRLRQRLIDPHTDGCHDGLGAATRNDNQGAESTIAYAATWLSARAVRPPTHHDPPASWTA